MGGFLLFAFFMPRQAHGQQTAAPMAWGRGKRACRLALLLAALAVSVSAQAKVFDAQSFTLPNGLEVVVVANDRAPVATSMLWYKVGAADEPWGKSGNAHFFEHLMFKGTRTLKPGAFSKTVRMLGGNDNAFTGQDYTAYFQSIAVDSLEKVLAMEADRMHNLAPPPEEFASEHKVILEERRERVENDPQARFTEQLGAALYVNHPYGRPIVGWYDEMQRLDWPTAKAFYERYYRPDNAILVVSGDVTADSLRPMVERTFGKLGRGKGPVPERVRAQTPPLRGETIVRIADPAVRQPLVRREYRVPSARLDPQESLALELLAEILGGGPSTRLYREIVVARKLATGIDMDYDAARWDESEVVIDATPGEGVRIEDLAAALDAELVRVAREGVSDQELRTAKDALQAAAIYARDSLAGPAMIVGRALATGQTLEAVENWPERIEAVTLQSVQEVAAKYLDPRNPETPMYVTGYLTGAPEEEKEKP